MTSSKFNGYLEKDKFKKYLQQNRGRSFLKAGGAKKKRTPKVAKDIFRRVLTKDIWMLTNKLVVADGKLKDLF
jgi:hypothetical protein